MIYCTIKVKGLIYSGLYASQQDAMDSAMRTYPCAESITIIVARP